MAARRNGNKGGNGNGSSRRRGNPRNGNQRQDGGKKKNSTLLYVEIFGAAVLAILVIVAMSGDNTNKPPKAKKPTVKKSWVPVEKAPTKAPKKTYAAKDSYGWAKTTGLDLDGKKGIKPPRPAPNPDMTRGNKLYLEAKELYEKQEIMRSKGRADESRKMLRQASEKLEQAVASVKDLDMWLMEANMEGWIVDNEIRKNNQIINRWGKLEALIHKVLPKTD